MSLESIKEKVIGKEVDYFVKSTDWKSGDAQISYEDQYGIKWSSNDNIESISSIWGEFGSTKCGVTNTLTFDIESGKVKNVNLSSDYTNSQCARGPSKFVQEQDLEIIEEFIDRYLK